MPLTNATPEAQIALLEDRIRALEQSALSGGGLLPPPDKLEKLKFYRSEDAHEWSLLSSRVSSYITSQSFLVSAYAISMSNTNPQWGHTFTLVFPLLVATLGLATSWSAYPGIVSARKVIETWRVKRDKLFLLNPDTGERDHRMDDYRDERMLTPSRWRKGETIDALHVRSLEFALLTPWLFGLMWVALTALTLYLHYMRT